MATPPRPQESTMPPAAPPPDITQTPEFRKALEDAVGAALAQALAPLREQISAAKPGDVVDGGHVRTGPTEELFQRLALAIADVSDQGTGRPQRIAPEILARREAARKRMLASIEAMRARVKELLSSGKKGSARAATPRYRAMTKMWLNEQFIEPFKMDAGTRQPVPVEFFWTGPPNQAMRPINEAALEIFGHYRDWIGGVDIGESKAGYVSPGGVVILVGENSTPPITAMQRRGFQPDFGGMDLEARDDDIGGDPNFESDLAVVSDYGKHGVSDPRKREVNVLGTVMPAAVQGHPNDVVRRGI